MSLMYGMTVLQSSWNRIHLSSLLLRVHFFPNFTMIYPSLPYHSYKHSYFHQEIKRQKARSESYGADSEIFKRKKADMTLEESVGLQYFSFTVYKQA